MQRSGVRERSARLKEVRRWSAELPEVMVGEGPRNWYAYSRIVVVYRESLDRFCAVAMVAVGRPCSDWNCAGKLFPGVEL